MSRIASLLLGGIVAFSLVGCDVDLEDREPDAIDSEPGDLIIEDERDPGVNVDVDDQPDTPRPGVDVDVDADRPDTTTGPQINLNPPGTAGEGTTPQAEPEG